MSAEQVTRLQGLLAKVQRNAGAYAPPAPPAAPSQDDVDELLGVSAPEAAAPAPTPSPGPVEIDVPFETIPPLAAAAAPEAEPIALVAMTTTRTEVTTEDGFSLEKEVSEVRIATNREPAMEVSSVAVAADVAPAEELGDDDLVEVPATADANDVDIDFEDEEEQPPASSQRSTVAGSLDEALAAAAASQEQEAEREVPLKTPPPESGPQEAAIPMPAGIAAPPAPDVDALLGAEAEIPTTADTGPTQEQLGQTIDLEEARGPQLELDTPRAEAMPAPAQHELEMPLPAREALGSYDDGLLPPPEARDELEAHRRRLLEEPIPPPPESLAQLPPTPMQSGFSPIAPVLEAPGAEAAPSEDTTSPEVFARPAPPLGAPETIVSVREPFRPSSFVGLLDASLSLDGD